MQVWVEKRLRRPPLTNDQPLSLVRFAPYSDDLGFRVCVDAAQNLPNDGGYVFCITSLSPPGLYYREQPLTDDAIVTSHINLESTTSCPEWPKITHHDYRDVPAQQNTLLVVDVQAISDPAAKTATPLGWTVVPVFVEDAPSSHQYVLSGNYQVPLFEGKVPTELLETIRNHPTCEVKKLIRCWCGKEPEQYSIKWLSLIHISEPTRLLSISYAVFCLKKKKGEEKTGKLSRWVRRGEKREMR
eukprot:TRINITY_DN49723_c0_g1_i1.p1 TRINITY_DN49723_c0_g1~~TRINITY_DN49723_c0_g1_i1.p1  ORF type:complete len:243 (+),score=50.84 TRINITY_DN49723_c0_g1_i1:626-1354(+)